MPCMYSVPLYVHAVQSTTALALDDRHGKARHLVISFLRAVFSISHSPQLVYWSPSSHSLLLLSLLVVLFCFSPGPLFVSRRINYVLAWSAARRRQSCRIPSR